MQQCQKCEHKFNYLTMFKAMRNITCPSCNSSYKVDAKSKIILVLTLVGAMVVMQLSRRIISEELNWLSFIIGLAFIYLVTPFNQKLVSLDKEK